MAATDDFVPIAYTQKTYGIDGELVLLFSNDAYAELDSDFYFLKIEGILVPFYVEEFIFVSETSARVKFEDIEDEKVAARYTQLEVLLPRDQLQLVEGSESGDWHFFVGFTVSDQLGISHGRIIGVDNSTMNVLFIVKNGDQEHLIPATEDFIMGIDNTNRVLRMNLPEGLIDI